MGKNERDEDRAQAAAAQAASEKPAAVIADEAAAEAAFQQRSVARVVTPTGEVLELEPDPAQAPVTLAVPRDCSAISHDGRSYEAKGGRVLVPGNVASAIVASGSARFVPATPAE